MARLTCLVSMLLTHVALSAQSTDLVTKIEARVPSLLEEHHVPGLSMVLIEDFEVVWTGTFGVRRAGDPEPVTERTVFEACSMSKPLYAYAVLRLVEDGRLDLDRPLDEYLDESYNPTEPRSSEITARMVLSHTTGWPNWRDGGWRKGGPIAQEYPPGERFTYSGEGFLYLQTVVEHITGEPTEPFMRERLIRPLGMERSSYVWQERFEDDFAAGHLADGSVNTKRGFYERANVAFTLYTTPSDYAKILVETVRPLDADAEWTLRPKTRREMLTVQPGSNSDEDSRKRRGLGWVLGTPASDGYVNHSGSNGAGFRCCARIHEQRGDGLVIMTNSRSGRPAWEALVAIADEHYRGVRPKRR